MRSPYAPPLPGRPRGPAVVCTETFLRAGRPTGPEQKGLGDPNRGPSSPARRRRWSIGGAASGRAARHRPSTRRGTAMRLFDAPLFQLLGLDDTLGVKPAATRPALRAATRRAVAATARPSSVPNRRARASASTSALSPTTTSPWHGCGHAGPGRGGAASTWVPARARSPAGCCAPARARPPDHSTGRTRRAGWCAGAQRRGRPDERPGAEHAVHRGDAGDVAGTAGHHRPLRPIRPGDGPTAFTGARVIVGDGSTVLDNAQITVRDGFIESVTRTPSEGAPDSSEGPLVFHLAAAMTQPMSRSRSSAAPPG